MFLPRGVKVWKSEFGTKGFLYPTDSSMILNSDSEVESLPFVSSDRDLVAFKFKSWNDDGETPVHWVDVKTWNYARYQDDLRNLNFVEGEDGLVSRR